MSGTVRDLANRRQLSAKGKYFSFKIRHTSFATVPAGKDFLPSSVPFDSAIFF